MIFQQSQETLDQWKSDMHNYERGKRTKKPFGSNRSQIEYVTHQKIKNKECLFNPVLQTFQKSDDERIFEQKNSDTRAKSLINHLKNTIKYEKSFDIINLNSNDSSTPKPHLRKLGPIRNAYNVINNQQLPEYYFKNRDVRLPIEREKRLYDYHKKDFNIVTNVYKENHKEKMEKQINQQVKQVTNKYWATHNYNPVNGHFYDEKKEQEFQIEQKIKQKQHGKDFEQRLPVSYVYREPLILDYSKPLPESLRILDDRNHNAKKRFDTKYIVMDEYEKRNVEQQNKHDKTLKNHIHFGRILDQKYKSFDIINNQAYKPTRAQQLFGKKVDVTWEQLTKQAAKPQSFKQGIKSGGFT